MFIELFANMVAIMISISALVLMYMQYIKTRCDRQRYRFFSVRDKLYNYVLEGKVDKNSKAYEITENIITFSISAVKTYDIFMLLKIIDNMEALKSKRKKKNVTIYEQIKHNECLVDIYREVISLSLEVIKENSILVKLIVGLKRLGLKANTQQKEKVISNIKPIYAYNTFQKWSEQFA